MPQLVDPSTGQLHDVADADAPGALAAGWHPQTIGESDVASTAAANELNFGGVSGGIKAGLAGLARGATLGGSDVAARILGGEDTAKTLAGLQAQNPITSGVSEFAGALAPAVLSGGSATPAGAVSKLGQGVTRGLTREGAGLIERTAVHSAAAAAEGSLYGAGQYLSQVALEDKPISAEGFVGGMGRGALFAAPIGGGFSLAGEALLRARSLFPKSQITPEAAAAIKSDASAALHESIADADAMAQAARLKIAQADAQAGAAGARTQVTRAVFGGGDPAAIDAAAGANVNKEQLTAALSKLETSQVALKDWIASGGEDELADVALAAKRPVTPEVPVGEFGAPGARGYKPGEVPAPAPPSQAPLENAAEGTPVTRMLRKGAPSIEDIGAAPASGPSADTPSLSDIRPSGESPATAVGRRTPAAPTTPFDFKDSGLMFDPETRQYTTAEAGAGPSEPPMPEPAKGKYNAAGGVIVNGEGKIAIVKTKGGEHEWMLPKGRIDPGETPAEAALREVREESGAKAEVGPHIGDYDGNFSKTRFYLMRHSGNDLAAMAKDGEMAAVKFVSPDEAEKLLSHPMNKRALADARKMLDEHGPDFWSGAHVSGKAEPLTPDEFSQYAEQWRGGLNKEATDALETYSRNGTYGLINAPLREFGGNLAHVPDWLHGTVAEVDKAVAAAPAPRDLVAFRGLNGRRSTAQWADAKVGDSIVDHGFGSASASPKIGQDYARGMQVRPGVELHIDVPKGYPAAPIPSSIFGGESELLLPRNTKYTVTKIEQANGGKIVHVTASPAGEASGRAASVAAPETAMPSSPTIPDGFDVDAKSDAGRVFTKNPDIRQGVPKYRDLSPLTYRGEAYVVRPSELSGPKLRGIASGEDMLADPRTAKVREAWGKSERVPGVEIDVDSEGHYFVADGNHRLMAAALEGDRPILARFRPVEAEVGNMDHIGDDLSRALERGKPAVAPADDLLAQLQGTATKLGEGRSIGEIGASSPARAEYVSKKLAKREADASYFRAKAKGAAPDDGGDLLSALQGTSEGLGAGKSMRELSGAPMVSDQVGARGAALEDIRPAAPEPKSPSDTTRLREMIGGLGGGSDLPVSAAEYSARREAMGFASATAKKNIGRAADNDAIEALLQKRTGKNVDMAPALERAAKVIGDHEAASAEVADLLGADAPKTAVEKSQALAAARQAHAEAQGASAAKAAQGINDRGISGLGDKTVVDPGIRERMDALRGRGDKTVVDPTIGAALREQGPVGTTATTKAKGSIGGKLADVGTALEVMKALGVHVPALSAIPVIGPVLGLFLKARAVLGILGRKGGSVGRDVDGLIAAASAATRDRIAKATQAILTGAGKGALKISESAAGPSVTLSYKLFPGDGITKSKDPQKLYEARMDEIARAQQPNAIDHAIADRYQTSDPALHDAIVGQVQRGISFLDSKAPKPSILQTMLPGDGVWKPSKAQLDEFGKYVHAVGDPASVLEDLAKGHVTLEGAETLRIVYPELFAEAQRMLMQSAPTMQKTLPYPTRVAISILYRVPVDNSMAPGHLQYLQAPTPGAQPAAPTGGPPPSAPMPPAITGPLQLGQSTMTALDRRAGA